jgi:hypothetical protein
MTNDKAFPYTPNVVMEAAIAWIRAGSMISSLAFDFGPAISEPCTVHKIRVVSTVVWTMHRMLRNEYVDSWRRRKTSYDKVAHNTSSNDRLSAIWQHYMLMLD